MNNRSSEKNQTGFTLIELLIVITIIGVLAAFTIPALQSVSRTSKISQVKAEMAQIEVELDNYKAQFGFYPPSNGAGIASAVMNQLYYELSGVKSVVVNAKPSYQTLDTASTMSIAFYNNLFKTEGAVNCSRGNGEDAVPAKNFFYNLKPTQVGSLPITNSYGAYAANFLVTSVGGPDANYKPLGFPGLNPFRYASPSPTNNNANGYDLWIQLVIGGKTNLISNWSQKVLPNSSLP